MFQNELSKNSQLVISKTAVRRQGHRIKPELRVASGVSHVNVWWLTILKTIEEESVPTDPERSRLDISLLFEHLIVPEVIFPIPPHVWLTLPLQPRRLTIAPADVGCKRCWAAVL